MIKAEIYDSELQKHIETLEKDGMTVFIAADGLFRGAIFHGTRFVNQMRAQHKLGILETMILGQASLCAALMIQTMKGREHLKFRCDTNGPAAGFSVEADSTGYVRGFLLQNNIPVDKPLESWDLAPFFGEGTISVTRYPEAHGGKSAQVQTGVVEIKHRNIAQDLAWYFHQSEQISTAFNTSIQLDKRGRVVGAGGLFVQAMPLQGGKSASAQTQNDCAHPLENGLCESRIPHLRETERDDLIRRMENAFSACPPLGQWFSEKGNREDIIYGLFREFMPQAVLERDIIFDCPCSKERYIQSIRTLPKSEFDDIKRGKTDPIEVVCHNCASVYTIQVSEL
ncbi:Hsp33 family molecular chaperone HslO [Treponema sp. OMZ 840]|uniref:Hsp33 family molecular chaperone HslO n=1 Tax=Treponema sp. OMZ 840 TaxID=244313 RepID=UPI003D8AC9F3